jgi:hypothetical protein
VTRTAVGGPRATVAAHGLRVALPPRWEARLYLRDQPATATEAAAASDGVSRWAHPAAHGWPGELPNPVLHLANFALPPGRGDFGTGAVERMGGAHAFVSLFEYDAEEAGRPLFAARGLPRPQLREFAANSLQRRLPGQLGCQKFFTESGRAFCLYIVLGSRQHAEPLVAEVHGVLANVEVSDRWLV